MSISIIIPTYQEEEIIGHCLNELLQVTGKDIEIIVVDAGNDRTADIVGNMKQIRVLKSKKGRAHQMNHGARIARGKILFFVHADTTLKAKNIEVLQQAINEKYNCGCFQMRFDDPHFIMRIYGWFTRFDWQVCRGGDQTLFVRKGLFDQIGGFDEKLKIMEDIDIIKRLKQVSNFRILPSYVVTSSRKYRKNGRIRLQLIFGMIHLLYSLGFKQSHLLGFYKKYIR